MGGDDVNGKPCRLLAEDEIYVSRIYSIGVGAFSLCDALESVTLLDPYGWSAIDGAQASAVPPLTDPAQNADYFNGNSIRYYLDAWRKG